MFLFQFSAFFMIPNERATVIFNTFSLKVRDLDMDFGGRLQVASELCLRSDTASM